VSTSEAKWKESALGEVVDILDSRRVPVNSDERKNRVGDVPYYGATGQVGWIDKHLFDEELVLLGEDGAPFLDSAKPKAYLVRWEVLGKQSRPRAAGKSRTSKLFFAVSA
jgi:type I restriction enzyme S subunit